MAFVRWLGAVTILSALFLMTAAPSGAEEKVVSNRTEKKTVPKTPLAAYQKQVTDAIGSKWYAYTNSKKDLLITGTVRMNFRILADGRVTELKVLSNTSSEAFAIICTQAVLDSKFPPIPEAVRRATKQDFIDFENISFTFYPD